MKSVLPKNSSRARNIRGTALSGCLFFLILAAALGYIGFKFAEPLWEYLQVREKTREALTWAAAGQSKSERDIVQQVLAKNREIDMGFAERNVKVTHLANQLIITVSWQREVVFPVYTLPLNFQVELSEEKRWGRGGLILK